MPTRRPRSNMEDESAVERPQEDNNESSDDHGISSAVSSIYGGAKKIGSFVVPPTPDLWPDMDKVDDMVQVITYAGYALISFGVIGSAFFALKTTRELAQWRTWLKFRKFGRRW
ncbi:Hypothetical predicted protein [Paramuricea clavata]|uniref:Uncharacterized protein n=1 Tax=Paramuricea clavata TaxID=317549 RepID=A0A6S7GBP1_PARCT|nr:Hypothetical predicted protein [Paramuricea clavata]